MKTVNKKMQMCSGVFVGLYVVFHLTNVAAAALGDDYFDRFMNWGRTVYHQPLVELLLATAIVIHCVTSVINFLLYSPPWNKLPLLLRVHKFSGFFLLVIIFIHVTFTRVLPMMEGYESSFKDVLFTVYWVPIVFLPYYVLYALAGIIHTMLGTVQIFQYAVRFSSERAKFQFLSILGIGFFAAVVNGILNFTWFFTVCPKNPFSLSHSQHLMNGIAGRLFAPFAYTAQDYGY